MPMKRGTLLVVLAALFAAPCGWGAGNRVGKWQIDLAESNFGNDPAPKSMTLTIFEDSATDFGYRVNVVNADQSHFEYEWRGTKDGIPHPVHSLTSHDVSLPAAIREVDGDLVEHGIEPDGMLESSRLSVSQDGRTLTIDIHWIRFQGAEIRRKWCFHPAP